MQQRRIWGVVFLALFSTVLTAQDCHLRLLIRDGGEGAGTGIAEVQIRSAGQPFFAGSGNLVLRYNPAALSVPEVIDATPGEPYFPPTLTLPLGPGTLSFNIEQENTVAGGIRIAEEFQTIATLRYRVIRDDLPADFRWEIAAGRPVTTILFAADERTLVKLKSAEVVAAPSAESSTSEVLQEFRLLPNYPNPFNPATQIRFQLPETDQRVQLLIFNSLGAKVRTLVDDHLIAGIYEARWDATNDRGEAVASGIYFVQLRAGAFRQTRRMVLLR